MTAASRHTIDLRLLAVPEDAERPTQTILGVYGFLQRRVQIEHQQSHDNAKMPSLNAAIRSRLWPASSL